MRLAYISFSSLSSFQPDGNVDSSLGMPLADWVEQHIVDPLTGRLHTLLRETAHELASSPPQPPHPTNANSSSKPTTIRDQISLSLYKYPTAAAHLSSLRQLLTHQIDMGALIRAPAELFGSEEVWAGREWKRRRMEESRHENAGEDASAGQDGCKREENIGVGLKENLEKEEYGMAYEGPDLLQHVLDYSAGVITDLDRRLRVGPSVNNAGAPPKRKLEDDEENKGDVDPDSDEPGSGSIKGEGKENTDEDPTFQNLRLNLLALAKRAPLDRIARLPADLVPEHIRLYVPTLG
jgi:bromodomain-containing protein 7